MGTVRPVRARVLSTVCVVAALAIAQGWCGGARSAPTHRPAARAPVAATAPRGSAPSGGGWSPAGCGREPVAPIVETSTVARYNASIDAVTSYDAAARAFNGCVSRSAGAEQAAISADAKRRIDAIQAVSEAVQRRIAANFQALGAALKKAPPTR